MVSNSRLLFALFLTTLLVVPDFTEGLFGIGGGKKDEKKRKDCSELGKQHRCIGASLKCQKPADDGHCGIGKKCCAQQCRQASDCSHCPGKGKAHCYLNDHRCQCD